MNDLNRRLIQALWEGRPKDIRSTPATESALTLFESEFGAIPGDFRWFLMKCGGGVVGSEWVDDIELLAASHRKYRRESSAGHWNSTMFIIGWTGRGQPMGVDPLTHAVVLETDEEVQQLSPCIEHFLLCGLAE